MNMIEIVLDIETIPCKNPVVKAEFLANVQAPGQYKKTESIAEWLKENAESAADEAWRKTSFDGALGHICVIGYAWGDKAPVAFHSADEVELLQEFFADINAIAASCRNERLRFIGHNMIDFDLRFIKQRAMILGVKPSPHIPFNAKHWDDVVFDTMQQWDAKNRISLDKLSKAFGLEGKQGIDGSMVCDMVAAGKIKEVAEYCCDDVRLTREVYKRMTFQS